MDNKQPISLVLVKFIPVNLLEDSLFAQVLSSVGTSVILRPDSRANTQIRALKAAKPAVIITPFLPLFSVVWDLLVATSLLTTNTSYHGRKNISNCRPVR